MVIDVWDTIKLVASIGLCLLFVYMLLGGKSNKKGRGSNSGGSNNSDSNSGSNSGTSNPPDGTNQ